MAGNETYSTRSRSTSISGRLTAGSPRSTADETPDGSNFYGVLTITGWCKDDVPGDGHVAPTRSTTAASRALSSSTAGTCRTVLGVTAAE